MAGIKKSTGRGNAKPADVQDNLKSQSQTEAEKLRAMQYALLNKQGTFAHPIVPNSQQQAQPDQNSQATHQPAHAYQTSLLDLFEETASAIEQAQEVKPQSLSEQPKKRRTKRSQATQSDQPSLLDMIEATSNTVEQAQDVQPQSQVEQPTKRSKTAQTASKKALVAVAESDNTKDVVSKAEDDAQAQEQASSNASEAALSAEDSAPVVDSIKANQEEYVPSQAQQYVDQDAEPKQQLPNPNYSSYKRDIGVFDKGAEKKKDLTDWSVTAQLIAEFGGLPKEVTASKPLESLPPAVARALREVDAYRAPERRSKHSVVHPHTTDTSADSNPDNPKEVGFFAYHPDEGDTYIRDLRDLIQMRSGISRYHNISDLSIDLENKADGYYEPTDKDYEQILRMANRRHQTQFSNENLDQNVDAMLSWNQSDELINPSDNMIFGSYSIDPDLEPVYESAVDSKLIQAINLAYIQYLMQNYAFEDKWDQSAFNVILLSLFSRMNEGHICVKLDSDDSLSAVLSTWIDPAKIEARKEKQRLASIRSILPKVTPLQIFAFNLNKYAPKNLDEMEQLICGSKAVVHGEQLQLEELPELPLVWDLHRLYIRRNYIYEQQISKYIKNVKFSSFNSQEESRIKTLIDVLFPQEEFETSANLKNGVNWQKVAALMSLVSNFTVISGGPGTGKTTTVFNLLLLLQCLHEHQLNIMMCAPTAKAAARMGESIANQLNSSRSIDRINSLCKISGKSKEQINALFDVQATTVHRLLKVRPHLVTPVFNENNKLSCDVLVVDEVSMLDLSMFAKLLAALPQGCKLILLGDKDQLSSVGAGMVLGDICSILSSADPNRIKPEVLEFLHHTSAYSREALLEGKIADHITLLQHIWRSSGAKDINKLANIFNNAICKDVKEQQDQSGQSEQDREQLEKNSSNPALLLDQIKTLCGFDEVADKELKDSIKAGKPIQRPVDASKNASPLVLKILPDTLKEGNADSDTSMGNTNPHDAILKRSESKKKADQHYAEINYLRYDLVKSWVDPNVTRNYGPFLSRLKELNFRVDKDSKECEELFNLMDNFRVLCSNHSDWFGDISLNKLMENEILKIYVNKPGSFQRFTQGDFFPGQIILITENDPMLNLVNGSVGFCAYEDNELSEQRDFVETVKQTAAKLNLSHGATEADSRYYRRGDDPSSNRNRTLRLFVKDGTGKGAIKVISTMLLNSYESGFAMSIHKSQGSEYKNVAIALNMRINPILTKELVYTGITRAKNHVELVGSEEALKYALSHAVIRESGLAERIFGKNLV